MNTVDKRMGGIHPPGYPWYLRYNFWTEWVIIKIVTSKCVQMDPQQPPKM